MVQQFLHGTQYIDELIMVRVKDKGDLYVQETGYGDREGEGDVDSTDKGTVGTTCTGTISGACRVLDLDFDGDYDSTDATKFDALPQGYMVRPGRHRHQPALRPSRAAL